MGSRFSRTCLQAVSTTLTLLWTAVLLSKQAPAPPPPSKLPERLSQTGLFSNLSTLSPSPGVVPYEVNVPYWTDGTLKRRWIVLPGDGSNRDPRIDRIIVKPGLPWGFPSGTLFVQHFDWIPDSTKPSNVRRLETRVLVRDKESTVYGVTYKWNEDGSDAELLRAGVEDTLRSTKADGSTAELPWSYPSPDQCVLCHNPAAGGVLGANYRQLNRTTQYGDNGSAVNQVVAWNAANMLSKSLDEAKALQGWNLMRLPFSVRAPFWNVPQQGQLDPPGDEHRPVEARARAYLDANCSYCHAPGIVNADFDARSTTPLDAQHLIGGKARIPRLGAEHLIEPGAPEKSLVYLRVTTTDPATAMPPVGRHTVDPQAKQLLDVWIRGMPAGAATGAAR